MLDRERACFTAHADEWEKQNPGRFVVVKGDALVGTYSTLDEALSVGAQRFGLESFLVRQLGAKPEPISIPTLGLLHADP